MIDIEALSLPPVIDYFINTVIKCSKLLEDSLHETVLQLDNRLFNSRRLTGHRFK